MRLARIQSEFKNGVKSRQGWIFEVPSGMDTSCSSQLEWKWIANDNPTKGVVKWVIRWGYSRDYDEDTGSSSNIFQDAVNPTPSTGPNEQSVIFTQTIPQRRKQLTSYISLDISEIITHNINHHGDLMWVSIERDGTTDTYGSSITICQASLRYVSWNEGHYNG